MAYGQLQQKQVTAATVRETFSGPIPPPAVLEGYNRVVPGAAERILQMAEAQAAHRMALEKGVIASDIKKSERGQWFALIVAIVGLVVAAWLGNGGHTLASSTIGGGGLTALAAVFIYGRREKRKELERARERSPKIQG